MMFPNRREDTADNDRYSYSVQIQIGPNVALYVAVCEAYHSINIIIMIIIAGNVLETRTYMYVHSTIEVSVP